MGSTPTQQIKADLNGTGTLVDVSAYVDYNDGIKASTGRTDWTAAMPRPGSLTFNLDNRDGRFTPGNVATYTVGCVDGVLVEWTCGARVRRYRMGTPSLSFPGGRAGGSVVTVPCLDSLADLQKRRMRQMVDEVAFAVKPVAHWPLNDSGTGVTPQAADISGNAEAPLVAYGASALFGWATGVGPRTDGRAALIMQPDATTAPATTTAYLAPSRTLGTSGVTHTWSGVDTSTADNVREAGVSLWFSVRDIYGATSSTANDYDGPYVIIAKVGFGYIMWRIPDRKLVLGRPGNVPISFPSSSALQPGETHHVAVALSEVVPGSARSGAHVWIDGVDYGGAAPAYTTWQSLEPPDVRIGGGEYGALAPQVTGTDSTIYGFSGTIACVTIYKSDAITTAGGYPSFVTVDPTSFYGVGMTGPDELASARFTRLGGFLRRSDIAFTVTGTAQPSLIGPQDTGDESMLAVMCDALRMEEANLDTETLASVDTVRAYMSSDNRPTATAVTIDCDLDGQGTPALSFDASGVAVQVTARGFSTSVTWLDTAASARFRDTSTNVTAATDTVVDLRALAQFRSLLGRATTLVPTKVTVDAVNSRNNLTATLLTLRPMQRVALTGLPSSVVGYASCTSILVGVTERHSLGRSLFDLTLTPDLPYIEGLEGTGRAMELSDFTFDGVRWYPQIWGATNGAGMTNSQTTIYYADFDGNAELFLTTDSGSWPFDLIVDSERMSVTAVAAVVVPGGGISTQALTVTRGTGGTTAVTHTGLQVGPQAFSCPDFTDCKATF